MRPGSLFPQLDNQQLGGSGYAGTPFTLDTPEHHKVSRIPYRSRFQEPRIRAYLSLISVLAFPDTCSELNVLSESFVKCHGFPLDKGTGHAVRLPDGTRVKSLGSLTLPMRYEGEVKNYSLSFMVLRNCVQDVVLGNAFLRITETFTKFLQRLEWFPRGSEEPVPRVYLVGNPQQRVNGSINGHFVSASPDTGSDVNLISKDCAAALDLKISTDPTRIITLEFIDGSTALTYGVIPEVEWRFDEDEDSTQRHRSTSASKPKLVQDWDFGSDASPQETYICDFYVLEQLTSPVVLCSDLLLGSNAFAACANNFYQTSRLDKRRIEDVDICYIREKKSEKKVRRSLRQVLLGRARNSRFPTIYLFAAETYLQVDGPPPAPATATQIWEAEIRRRGDEADRIAELPPNERATAQEVENRRIQQWDVNQASPQNQQTHTQQSTSSSQAQPQSTNTQSSSTLP